MTDVNAMISNLMRSGQFAGFNPSVKTLAVVDNREYQKDFSYCNDAPLSQLYQSVKRILPDKYDYRYTYVADEYLAMCLFQQRSKGNWSDKIKACMLCKKRGKMLTCGRCRQVLYCSKTCQTKHWHGVEGGKWAHKKACKLMAGKPRVILNDLPDSTSVESLGLCGQGFVMIEKMEQK